MLTGVCFSLQRDEAAKQCRQLSQELLNLRGELGKSGHLDVMPSVYRGDRQTPGPGLPVRLMSLFALDHIKMRKMK